MGRKEITTKEDLMKVIELFENTGITYWLDGGWGVDILAGKQTRIHRDIDINFDAQHTEKLLNVLLNLGYKIDTDWKPVRIELYSDELGYLDIHPFVLNEDGTSKQADLEGGWYEFEKDYFGSVFFEAMTSVHSGIMTGSFSIGTLQGRCFAPSASISTTSASCKTSCKNEPSGIRIFFTDFLFSI